MYFVLAIYISGDTEVPCGETARFEAEIAIEQDVYRPLSWDRVDGLVRKQIDIEDDKYRGSDNRKLIISNVSRGDEAGYQAVISRNHDVKILSNTVYLRPKGGIYSFQKLFIHHFLLFSLSCTYSTNCKCSNKKAKCSLIFYFVMYYKATEI